MDKEILKRFTTNTDETGRMIVTSLKTGRKYFIEAIGSGYNEVWGDVDPATKKMTGSYGDKYTGSVRPEQSLITEENGFKNIVTLKVGESPFDENRNPSDIVKELDDCVIRQRPDYYVEMKNTKYCYVEGIFNSFRNLINMRKSIWFSKAEDRHFLRIPEGGAWTLMFEGRPKHKWGFYVNGHKWRPLRYFHKFGIRQDKNYQ